MGFRGSCGQTLPMITSREMDEEHAPGSPQLFASEYCWGEKNFFDPSQFFGLIIKLIQGSLTGGKHLIMYIWQPHKNRKPTSSQAVEAYMLF